MKVSRLPLPGEKMTVDVNLHLGLLSVTGVHAGHRLRYRRPVPRAGQVHGARPPGQPPAVSAPAASAAGQAPRAPDCNPDTLFFVSRRRPPTRECRFFHLACDSRKCQRHAGYHPAKDDMTQTPRRRARPAGTAARRQIPAPWPALSRNARAEATPPWRGSSSATSRTSSRRRAARLPRGASSGVKPPPGARRRNPHQAAAPTAGQAAPLPDSTRETDD